MNEGVAIEWLMLADAAQVVGNKLYVLGGGWDRYAVSRPFPVAIPLSVSVAIRVPWHETNQRHTLAIEFQRDEGQTVHQMTGQFEVGRPPGIPQGMDQRVQLTLTANLKVDGPGVYRVLGKINDQEKARTPFTIIARQAAAPPKPPQ
jgi:hypothetical protein